MAADTTILAIAGRTGGAFANAWLCNRSGDTWQPGQVIIELGTTAAKACIKLTQGDVDEDYFEFIGTSGTVVGAALVDAVNFSTPGAIVGWFKCRVQDDQATDPIPDGDYYMPFYAAPTV